MTVIHKKSQRVAQGQGLANNTSNNANNNNDNNNNNNSNNNISNTGRHVDYGGQWVWRDDDDT